MGEGYPNVFNNRPFLHFSIGVGNTHRILNIADFEDGIHAVIVEVTKYSLCVSMSGVDKGCVSLPNGHNVARSVKYERNTALGFGSINNVYVESCVEDVLTLDICDSINYSFGLEIIGYSNYWSFVFGNVFDYRLSCMLNILYTFIVCNNIIYVHIRSV